jgi:hypothetical protein
MFTASLPSFKIPTADVPDPHWREELQERMKSTVETARLQQIRMLGDVSRAAELSQSAEEQQRGERGQQRGKRGPACSLPEEAGKSEYASAPVEERMGSGTDRQSQLPPNKAQENSQQKSDCKRARTISELRESGKLFSWALMEAEEIDGVAQQTPVAPPPVPFAKIRAKGKTVKDLAESGEAEEAAQRGLRKMLLANVLRRALTEGKAEKRADLRDELKERAEADG